MFWFVLLNLFLWQLIIFPRRTLAQTSFFFYHNRYRQEGVLTKLFKKVIIKSLKPFLVRDKANNLTFFCFCNTLLALMVFDLPEIAESLIISVNAACLFHFFVITLPNERKKVATLRKLGGMMSKFMQRDDSLYKMLGYDLNEVDLTEWDNYGYERLKAKILARMPTKVGYEDEYPLDDVTEPNTFGFVKSNALFNEVWACIVEYDKVFLSVIHGIDLTLFPDLSTVIDDFSTNHCRLTGAGKEAEWPLIGYLIARQRVIAEYTNTAGNYTHCYEQRFMNYITRCD